MLYLLEVMLVFLLSLVVVKMVLIEYTDWRNR